MFDPKFHKKDFNFSTKMHKLMPRYNELKLLQSKQSLPCLSTWNKWKAHQIRTFFLYLVCPLMHKKLPDHRYGAVQFFVEGSLIISKTSVSEDDIIVATCRFKLFAVAFNNWGDNFMNINEHDIVHLPQQVKKTGPVWTASGFQTENNVGQISKST